MECRKFIASKKHLTITYKIQDLHRVIGVSSPRSDCVARPVATGGRVAPFPSGDPVPTSPEVPGALENAPPPSWQGAPRTFPSVTSAPTIPSRRPLPILPSRDRAQWRDETGTLPLCYLAWGARDYTTEPIPRYRCGGWQYILVQSSSATLAMDGVPRVAPAGTMLMLGPERAFGWRAGRGRLLNCMWASPATRELGSLPLNTFAVFRATAEAISEFEDMHARCREEVASLDAFSPSALYGCQLLLEALILRALQPSPDSMDRRAQRIDLARRWMAEHLDSHEPIARLSDYLAVAPATLHREFVHQTGLSPADFFHKLKMRTALDLLREGFSIKETAANLGYRCFNDFSRAVHRYYGHPPSKLLQSPVNCPANESPLITVA